ncbi:hypothetical protein [Arcobacter sp.]|uniref:hypothetical protein n=1 Tax=unclassified Arcobacter TaxID=2593671 RepID=UPI003B00AEC0
MSDKELYQEQKKRQLAEYETQMKELKEKASAHDSVANTKLFKQIEIVELKLKEGKAKLKAFEKASKEEIEAHKKAIDDAFIEINIHLAMS